MEARFPGRLLLALMALLMAAEVHAMDCYQVRASRAGVFRQTGVEFLFLLFSFRSSSSSSLKLVFSGV